MDSANGASLTTLFNRNNNGDPGGAVYFNLSVGANPITITGFDTNTEETSTATSGFEVYTRSGTAQGFETSSTGWTLASNGTITPLGVNNSSPVTLNNNITLEANTLYGIALKMPSTVIHSYTDGTCSTSYTFVGNCGYQNGDLTLLLGSANNTPFSSSAFSPRIWNGTIFYDVSSNSTTTPEPSLLFGLIGFGTLGLVGKVKKNK
nr:hypothetical protein A5482_09015 [Cyanobacterium sp. IPPAS B-1200]